MLPDELVELGQIVRPFGIRGELKVRPVDAPGQLLSGLTEVYLLCGERTHGPIALEGARAHGNFALLKLAGYDTPESADALRMARVAVPYRCLPPLPPGEYYFCEILGSTVQLRSGETLGTVQGYVPGDDCDLLVVRDGTRERLIPTGDAMLLDFDRETRRLIVAWDPETADHED